MALNTIRTGLAVWIAQHVRLLGLLLLMLGMLYSITGSSAQSTASICPGTGLQTGGAGFQPGGIILTSFDRNALWLYDIDSGQRYPLPDTTPCGRNCRLSPDARWITYFNTLTNAFNRMRVDGNERSLVSEYAADIDWWSPDTYLIWTPGHEAYLRADGSETREYLNVDGVIAVQPGGRWGLMVQQLDGGFERALVNLELRGLESEGISDGRVSLGDDIAYLNAESWSPDGQWLAYAAPVFDDAGTLTGSELFGIMPGETAPTQWTQLTDTIGRARINGLSVGELSWSPDSQQIAYWAVPLSTTDPAGPAGEAVIHILNIETGEDRVYCTFSTSEHTPNPPRLVWSPRGTHLAFGGNVPADDRGYLLLILDTETGALTALSEGIYPAFGAPDVVAWGLRAGE